jgi:Lar family restriction alleviation protein
MTSPDLLPCPFCGGKAEIVEIEEGENAGGSCVCCSRCMASGNVEFGFKENFVSNWNRRADASRRMGYHNPGR